MQTSEKTDPTDQTIPWLEAVRASDARLRPGSLGSLLDDRRYLIGFGQPNHRRAEVRTREDFELWALGVMRRVLQAARRAGYLSQDGA